MVGQADCKENVKINHTLHTITFANLFNSFIHILFSITFYVKINIFFNEISNFFEVCACDSSLETGMDWYYINNRMLTTALTG